MELASLAQLDRSHRRHDDVVAGLLAAARRLAAGRPEAGDLDAVHGAVAYFLRAVPRHFLDEEGSVFPRLSTRRPELAEALAALSAEHPAQIALHNAVAEAARLLDGDARQTAGKQLLELAEKLADQHAQHVAREDVIFQGANGALTAEDDAEIVAEMETRRDRDDSGGGRRRATAHTTKQAKHTTGPRRAAKTAAKRRPAKPAKKPKAGVRRAKPKKRR